MGLRTQITFRIANVKTKVSLQPKLTFVMYLQLDIFISNHPKYKLLAICAGCIAKP